jgi:putative spermidine/putrescine transport system permease protein
LVLAVLFGGGLVQALATSLEGGGAAWARTWENPDLGPSLWLTVRVAGVSTLLSMVLAVGAALWLRRVADTAGGRVARAMTQVPLPVPHLVIALALVMLLTPSGMANRMLAAVGVGSMADPILPSMVNDGWGAGIVLAYVWKETPFITVLVLSALRGETRRLEEAARNLGAGVARVFWTVTLPAMAPALRLGGLLVFAYAVGAFEVPLIMGRTRPTMLGVLAWQLYTDVDLARRPEAMVVALVILAVILAAAGLTWGGARAARRLS